MRKAQIAMETIMIYGAAILVVTLAIGVLIYSGVLDLGKLLPDKCDTGGKLVCENFQVTTGGIKLEFRNRVGRNLDTLSATVVGIEDWENLISCSDSTPNILNGELGLIDDLGTCNLKPEYIGKKIKARVTVTYRVKGSNIDQTEVGELHATVAEGAAPPTCSGTPSDCATFVANAVLCAEVGCTYDAGPPINCTGTPNACNTYDIPSDCTAAGCTWS